ncbi:MAG: hypothetical protein LBE83_06270 [Propionibacteriaceae bacterium]|jgi:DNA-binding transcriptional regulator LsrR (DeoR family)|nr:hypothetical protein [Propionibacteriaceae bacterium]
MAVTRDDEVRMDRSTLAEIARLYYLGNLSKVDIALKYGISRFRVARALTQARDEGIVSITIQGVAPVDPWTSYQLSQHWGIAATVVDSGSGMDRAVRQAVGHATAEVFMDNAREDAIVGFAWGRTLTAMTDYVTRLPKLSVVQLIGAVTSDLDESPVELVRRTSASSGGRAYPIIAPAILDNEHALAALKSNPDVKAALDLFDALDMAFVAVGSWDPPASQIRGVLPQADLDRLDELAVKAEVAGVYFDSQGRIVAEDYSRRYLCISADQLRRVPRLVAAAGGRIKMEAVKAVVRSGMITDLVTDHTLAEAALQSEAITPASGLR